MPLHSQRWRLVVLVALVLLLGAAVAIPPLTGDGPESEGRAQPRRPADALAHLRELQRIADRYGGNRAAGTAGDRASVRYVEGRLRDAGYSVRHQAVSFPFFEERGSPRVRVGGRAVGGIATLSYSPGGKARGPLRVVDPGRGAGDDGCRRSDYAAVRRGDVALIERGGCRLRTKVDSAARAGAVAAIIFNDGRPGRRGTIPGSLGGPGARIPAVSAAFATGRRLARAEGRRVGVLVRTVSERRTTHNVIAQRPADAGRDVVMAGAHLDSVPEGPGINDNGSGVAALLDAAESLARERPSRSLRVAFWGAEEEGLIGSRRYVRRLPDGDRRRIKAYMNLDMVGSPKAGRFVYSSTDGDALAAIARRALERRGVDPRTRNLGGGSDHAPFDRAGIPIVGFFSGAGAPYDRCYHRRCDRLEGINSRALAELGGAATDTIRELLR